MLETYLFLTFNTAGLTHALKGVSLRPPICHPPYSTSSSAFSSAPEHSTIIA